MPRARLSTACGASTPTIAKAWIFKCSRCRPTPAPWTRLCWKGRWLLPEDENALVISSGLLHEDPDIAVGDDIVLKIKERETTWRVVGLMKAMGEARWTYSNLDYYERVARDVGKTSYLRVVTEDHSPAAQTQAAKDLEEHFEHSSVDISYTKTMYELSQGDREGRAGYDHQPDDRRHTGCYCRWTGAGWHHEPECD